MSESGESQVATPLPPKVEELRLMEVALEWFGESSPTTRLRVAGTSSGRGQACTTIATSFPHTNVNLWYLDQHPCELAVNQASLATGELPDNLTVDCKADLDAMELDVTLVPLNASGEQELARDMVQQHYDALVVGGQLFVSVDNAKDRWVHELLKTYEKSVRVRPFDDACVYRIEKTHPLKKRKDFSCELAFRDCDELIHFVTRPGVFSHRQLDNGARQLLDAVDVYPEARLIDIGCGSGSVTLGLAKRDPSASIHAVDSNARALWCVLEGAKRNGLDNVTVELNCRGEYRDPGSFDMALANPPYFSNFVIAEKFLQAAYRSLRPGGRLVLVTKQPKWYEENLPRWFEDCEVFESRRYHIASGVKSAAAVRG